MLLNIVYAIFFWIYVLFSYTVFIPERIFALLRQEGLRQRWMHLVGQIYSLILLTVGWSRIFVHHRERFPRRGLPVCIVSNHQAYADILVFLGSLPTAAGYIAKDSLKKVPVISTWMRALKCFFLKRDDMRSGIEAIRYGVKMIQSGYPMIIFPEGTRSRGPDMRPFHRGSLKMAVESRALLVPVSIEGTYKLLEGRNTVRRADVHVLFHEPIDCSKLSREEEKLLAERVYEIIRNGQQSLLKGEIHG